MGTNPDAAAARLPAPGMNLAGTRNRAPRRTTLCSTVSTQAFGFDVSPQTVSTSRRPRSRAVVYQARSARSPPRAAPSTIIGTETPPMAASPPATISTGTPAMGAPMNSRNPTPKSRITPCCASSCVSVSIGPFHPSGSATTHVSRFLPEPAGGGRGSRPARQSVGRNWTGPR